MIATDKKQFLEEEIFIVRYSGEIPEVAYQGSLYYLTEDPTGPGIELDPEDTKPLSQAVVERYREIVLRDLEPENRDKNLYRGLARCIVNWQRLEKFCSRENLELTRIRSEAAEALQQFLGRELVDVTSGLRISCVNCSTEEVQNLAAQLGLAADDLPDGWGLVCRDAD